MNRLYISLLFLLPSSCYATDSDLTHFAAHFGMSYTIQTVLYGFNSKVLKIDKLDSEILAFVGTMAIGLLYKENEGNSPNTTTAMEQNLLGATTAVASHLVFHF